MCIRDRYESQPEWVQEYPRGVEYPEVKYKEFEKGFIPSKYLTGHELFNWFMDARKHGPKKGKEWYPYFDKILKDEWEPYAKDYERIAKARKYGTPFAKGGLANLLGE